MTSPRHCRRGFAAEDAGGRRERPLPGESSDQQTSEAAASSAAQCCSVSLRLRRAEKTNPSAVPRKYDPAGGICEDKHHGAGELEIEETGGGKERFP